MLGLDRSHLRVLSEMCCGLMRSDVDDCHLVPGIMRVYSLQVFQASSGSCWLVTCSSAACYPQFFSFRGLGSDGQELQKGRRTRRPPPHTQAHTHTHRQTIRVGLETRMEQEQKFQPTGKTGSRNTGKEARGPTDQRRHSIGPQSTQPPHEISCTRGTDSKAACPPVINNSVLISNFSECRGEVGRLLEGRRFSFELARLEFHASFRNEDLKA